MNTSNQLGRWTILAAVLLVILLGTTSFSGHVALRSSTGVGTVCPSMVKCPIHDADSYYQYSEFSGMTEVGIYEHGLLGGGTHRFRYRCN
jgi:hypothetical protein